MFRKDGKGQTTARHELAFNRHPARVASLKQVVQNVVDDLLVERTYVAIRGQVELQGFRFDAQLVGSIINDDFSEIRLTGDWTKGGEIRAVQTNGVVPKMVRIRECFDPDKTR
jgi:hypothetical protein